MLDRHRLVRSGLGPLTADGERIMDGERGLGANRDPTVPSKCVLHFDRSSPRSRLLFTYVESSVVLANY